MSADGPSTVTLTNTEEPAVALPCVLITTTTALGSPVEAPLGLDPLVVGTGAECDLAVADVCVSRRHCEFRLTPRGIALRDLGSKNGTFLGEVAIVEVILPVGIPVTIGSTRLSTRVNGKPLLVPLSRSAWFGDAIGQSIPMRALFAKLERAAATSETILLLGESGTGKEVLANAIHAHSPRKDKPFVVFDGSAVAPTLIEDELFGHGKGAFTSAGAARTGLLAQADGGTLFIDEIGELPLDLQPKLLRALETRKVRRIGANEWVSFDTRVVAATHRNLKAQVASGAFRQDLYYRLAVVEANVPPLRERKDDIPLLVERFLAQKDPPRTVADLPPFAMELLKAHDWPGNVRELRNMVTRLMLFPEIGREALGLFAASKAEAAAEPTAKEPSHEEAAGGPQPRSPLEPAPAQATAEEPDAGLSRLLHLPLTEATDVVVDQFKRSYLTAKLLQHGGNVSHTADAIGVSRQYLYRLIERYGLRVAER